MRKNDSHRPNNWCVVNVQLDPEEATLFYQMQKSLGKTVSEIMKTILYPVIHEYGVQVGNAQKIAAEKVLGEKINEYETRQKIRGAYVEHLKVPRL